MQKFYIYIQSPADCARDIRLEVKKLDEFKSRDVDITPARDYMITTTLFLGDGVSTRAVKEKLLAIANVKSVRFQTVVS